MDEILYTGRHPDVITCATFSDYLLRGLGLAGVQILLFSHTFVVVLTNTVVSVDWLAKHMASYSKQ